MPKRPEIKALDLSPVPGGRAAAPHPVDAFTDDADAGRILNIPVSAIRPNPDQPRTYFDAEALRDLTESVRERGILQPIIVRRSGGADGFILIAGERRWRAATAAGLRKIPAMIRQKEDPAEIALIENLQREDLNPIEEAESLKRLKDRRHLTDQALARIIGKGRVSVTESLSLNTLPERIKADCRTSDKFTKGQLLPLVRHRNSDQQLALWQAMKDGNVTVREARTQIARGRLSKPGPRPYEHKFQPDDRTFTVRVTFRKSRASHDDIRDALREALKRLS
ncbi:MAG: ParB/RepB/Spo0J family partition protein [Deltaproteobacteria bacterium]|nr:ParB/RepB/Spo0J family partition protein [Deltaproteobacteria bacterium]